ncbi:MAG: hypothetical protein JW715_07555 [Sedimentisphaerales bacterium]|nr:hypothetical protein [Sedimentisphaerales bacterium]
MAEKQITCYPVDNGFAALLKLDNETYILFDINQFSEKDRKTKDAWDVYGSLVKVLPIVDNRRRLSVFCNTHADLDHCRNLDEVFYLPGQNKDSEELIHIDELWITAALFNDELESNEAKMLKKEAGRRLELAGTDKGEEKGNQIVVYGWSKDVPNRSKLPIHRKPVAGDKIKKINGSDRNDFEAFVHYPFAEAIADDGLPRNERSLILQIRIKADGEWNKILIGGDAGCETWGAAYDKTKKYQRLEYLDWDIFMIPHHGSYRFFSEKSREDARDNPDHRSIDIMKRGSTASWLICSSRKVKEGNYEDDDPPHIQAINHYKKYGRFECLHLEKGKAKPFILRFTKGGPQMKVLSPLIGTGTASIASNSTPRYGR